MLRSSALCALFTFGPLNLAFGQDGSLPALPVSPPSPITRSEPQSSNPLTIPTLPEPTTPVNPPLRPITPAPLSPNEIEPILPALPVEGDPLGSSVVSPLPRPVQAVERPFITPTLVEVILRGGVTFSSPNITGQRRPPTQFNLVAPWRFPGVEAAGLQAAGGFSLELGYQFTIVPVAFVARFSGIVDSQEIIFRNFDPVYDTYQNDPVVQRLREGTSDSDLNDTSSYNNVRVLSGQPDIFGSSLVESRLTVANVDFVAETPTFNVGWTSYRLWGGIRSTWFDLFDKTQGRGIEQIASTKFEGWGPILGGRANLSFNERNDLGVYVQLEGALLNGTVTQRFSEFFSAPYPNLFTYVREQQSRVVPNITLEIGLFGTSDGFGRSFFQAAYQFNEWINIGKIGNSNVSLHTHGIVARIGLNY